MTMDAYWGMVQMAHERENRGLTNEELQREELNRMAREEQMDLVCLVKPNV